MARRRETSLVNSRVPSPLGNAEILQFHPALIISFLFSLINSTRTILQIVFFKFFPPICSADDLSEFHLHARIITRVFHGAERMIRYHGIRACPTMNSYFTTRFSRRGGGGGDSLMELRWVGGAMPHHPPVLHCVARAGLPKSSLPERELIPFLTQGASSFLPRTSCTVYAQWRM